MTTPEWTCPGCGTKYHLRLNPIIFAMLVGAIYIYLYEVYGKRCFPGGLSDLAKQVWLPVIGLITLYLLILLLYPLLVVTRRKDEQNEE